MTPASGWHPDDYYRASRAARRAWQATDQQLAIGVGDGAAAKEATAAPSPTPVPPLDGSRKSHAAAASVRRGRHNEEDHPCS